MKRMMTLVLSLAIALSILSPATAYAAGAECREHNYSRTYDDKTFESDICNQCGFVRVHYTPYALPFVTRNEGIVAREAPRQAANVVKSYDSAGTGIQVVGRVRNEYNNLWLLLSDGSYTFADNAAFDFDAMARYAASSVNALAGPRACYMTYSPWEGLKASCTPSTIGIYGSMFSHFQPGGAFDLKQPDKLGLNTYDYYVYANGGLQDERYTGEKLGNILYGYMARKVGISERNAIRYAGLADRPQFGDTLACFFLGDLSRCDDEEDIDMIKLGWNRFSRRTQGGW